MESIVLANPAIALAAIGILALVCQWLAWWIKLPAILFLLITGILFGPVLGWLNPDTLFGDLLFPFISLAVAVVLFEGSLTLRFSEIKGLEHVVRRLVSTGLLITWGVTTLATYWLLNFQLELAILFGALIVVTGPTVIVPMLRSVRPTRHVANILRWEGIVIDPIGALLAVLVFQFIVAGIETNAFGKTLLTFAGQFFTGLTLGATAGYVLGNAIRHQWLPVYLHNLATLCLVLGVFALSNQVYHESGLLTVTVMGIWLANMKEVHTEDILNFKESLSLLFISGLFIILAARVDLHQFVILGWPALGILLAVQFIARPIKVAISTWGSTLNWRERAILAWISPRGIIAAAVSALFAIQLEHQGYAQASLLVPLTFMVIIGTVAFQSLTARPLAMWLKVAEPEPKGFLIVGANPLARTIAAALNKHGFTTLMADTNWGNIRAALIEGHQTFYGDLVSEQADRKLDLVGIGKLLSLSPHEELNCLAAMRYRSEFGDRNLYTLQVSTAEDEKKQPRPRCGQIAFGENVSYSQLTEMLSLGAKTHSTKLTEEFNFDDFYKKQYTRAVILFAITPRGDLRIFTPSIEIEPAPGWTIISLMLPKEDKENSMESDNNNSD
jgi:NhaP-type Na+/H+ or K+/H+ antiporter